MATTYGYDPNWTTDLGVHAPQHGADSLQGVLASIPGLSSYLAYDQYLNTQNKKRQIDEVLSNNPDAQSAIPSLIRLGPHGIEAAKQLAEGEKLRQDNAMGADIQKMMRGEAGTASPTANPALYRALGVKMNLAGKAGGAALASEADRLEKLATDKTALTSMKSAPEVPAVGAEGPQVPAPARPGGVPDYLLRSPHVGASAKSLQARIDSGMIPTAAAAEKQIENLGTAHNAMVQAKAILGQRGEQASELLTQRGEQKLNVTGGRESVYVQRMMMGANQASKDLANVVQLPLTASTGIFGGRKQGPGLFDAGKEVLANKATGQEAQAYNAMATGFQRSLAQIESAGLMPSGSLTHQMDAVLFKEGDTNLTKLHKLAQTRQIVEAGMEVVDANPRVSPEEKAKVKGVLDSIRKSVPFTHSDLIQLQLLQDSNPNATLKDVIGKKPSGWSIRPR